MSLIDHLKPFMQWLHYHPDLAALITFLIAMGESLAFFGLIIPGSVIMSAVGTLIGAGIIPGLPITLWAIVGAIVGDSISYYAGYRYTQSIRHVWPFKRYPQWITKAEDFFAKHGGKSVFLGRFVGPMRPIIPVVAGMMKLKPVKFFLSCTIASALWAPIYMLPGILIGAASQELAPETATRFVATILLLLFAFILTAWLFRWLISKLMQQIDRMMAYLWQNLYINSKHYWIKRWLTDPADPLSHSQLNRAVFSIFLILLFILLAIDISGHGLFYHLNQPIHQLFLNIHSIIMTKLMVCISLLADSAVLVPMVLILMGWMSLQRYWRAGLHLLGVVVLTLIMVKLAQMSIQSPRPDGLLYSISGNPFPSEGTALAIAVYGFLALLISKHFATPKIKRYIYWSVAVVCILIVCSCIYLGAHWLTDILAGTIIGLIATTVTGFSFFHRPSPRIQLPGLLVLIAISLGLTLTWQVTHNYREMAQIYTPYWPKYTATQADWWDGRCNTIPLFRPNRLGHPVQTMNIQWAGQISDIEDVFTNHDWHPVPKLDVIDLVNRVSSHDKEKRIPLLPPLYLGQPPVFEASKIDPVTKQLMLVRIWSANIQFSDVNLPLWVGTISYQLPQDHKFWLGSRMQSRWARLPYPTHDLSQILGPQFTWEVVHYDPQAKPRHIKDYLWIEGVIYIKPTPPAPTPKTRRSMRRHAHYHSQQVYAKHIKSRQNVQG